MIYNSTVDISMNDSRPLKRSFFITFQGTNSDIQVNRYENTWNLCSYLKTQIYRLIRKSGDSRLFNTDIFYNEINNSKLLIQGRRQSSYN